MMSGRNNDRIPTPIGWTTFYTNGLGQFPTVGYLQPPQNSSQNSRSLDKMFEQARKTELVEIHFLYDHTIPGQIIINFSFLQRLPSLTFDLWFQILEMVPCQQAANKRLPFLGCPWWLPALLPQGSPSSQSCHHC
jgi:hypothetical protein